MMKTAFLLNTVAQRPFISLISALIVGILLSTGVIWLQPNHDHKAFFQADDPWLIASENLQDTYTRDQNVMLVIKADSASAEGLFTQSGLQCLLQATESAWTLPYVTRVDSPSNFQYSQADQDDLLIRDLIDAELLDSQANPAYLAKLQHITTHEPQLRNRLISPDGSTAGINLTLHLDAESREHIAAAANAARQWRDDLGNHCPNTNRQLTGVIMINAAIADASEHDLKQLAPLMFVAIVLALCLLMRSLQAVIASLVVILLSISSGMGLAGWLGYSITPTLAIAPTMMMTMAVAHCIHLVSGVRDARQTQTVRPATLQALRLNILPIVITSVTTAVGFLGMRVADNPPIVELGTVAAAGVLAAMLFSLTLLPAWLLLTEANIPPQAPRFKQQMERLSAWVLGQRKRILAISALLVIGMAWATTLNRTSEDLVRYFKPSTEIRQATEFSLDNLTGFYQIQFSLDSGASNGIASPDYLNTLDQFAQWFMQQEGVIQVSQIGDIVKRLNMNMNGDDIAHYRIPEQRDLAAQFLLMYQMSLPFGLTLENLVTPDFSASRFVVTLGRVETNQMRQLEESAYQWLQTHAPTLAIANGQENRGAGPSMMYAQTAAKISGTMTKATFFALLGISLLLCLALRSWRWGLLSIIPNVVPAIIAFGVWGLINGHISMTVAMVSTMTLGIVVDDTVHFMSKYLYARRQEKLVPSAAIQYAFSTVGIALIATTTVLVAGFAVMSLSPFEPSARMSELALITIAGALVFDLLFLPALLRSADRGA